MPVGKKLAAERRSQGKALADIVSATKIMSRTLEALEDERWEELPAAPYVKGYIQSYAQALGLDARPFLEEYARDVSIAGVTSDDLTLEGIPERQVVPSRHEVHAIPTKAIAVVIGMIALVVLALWGISALAGRDDTPPPIPPETTATPSASPTSPPVGGSQGSASATTPESPGGAFELTVTVAQGKSTWMRVLVDGLVAYEGTLPGGQTKSWAVSDTAVVRVEDASAVKVTRDGEPVEFPDGDAGAAELTLSAAP